jgi:hypothetical protein
LRGLTGAARKLSRRRLEKLLAGAAATTLLVGLHAAPVSPATADCTPDQQCGTLQTLLSEAQDAQNQATSKWLPLAVSYKSKAETFELDWVKLTDAGQDQLSGFKVLDQAHKLEDGASSLKLESNKLNSEAIKLQTDVLKILGGESQLKGEALTDKITNLDNRGHKLLGLEGTLGQDAETLQTEYVKLLDELNSVSGPPTSTSGTT